MRDHAMTQFGREAPGFSRDARGNVAMMFGLLLAPLLLAGAIGIDVGRSADAKTLVQEAADMALLRVARMKTMTPALTEADLTDAAREIFDKEITKRTWIHIDEFAVRYVSDAETFELDVAGDVDTTLLGVVGVKELDLDSQSSVKLGKPPYLEVALALDNTGSMNSNGKLDAMKSAAAELTEAILAVDGATSKVGLVPFSQYVNIGSNGYEKFWMRDSSGRNRGRPDTDIDNSGRGNGGSRPPPPQPVTPNPNDPLSTWNGCVGSRPYPLNTENSNFVGEPVPEVYGGVCPNEITPLTSEKPLILQKIRDMQGRGNTYIASGVEWGWHVLTNDSPFREGVTLQELERLGGRKALILLTDGENTRAPDYPTHEAADRTLADMLTGRLCAQVKRDQITIYAIAFDVSDGATRALLEGCASSSEHYFAADDRAALTEAFRAVASSLRMLSLSK